MLMPEHLQLSFLAGTNLCCSFNTKKATVDKVIAEHMELKRIVAVNTFYKIKKYKYAKQNRHSSAV
jgi:hypothetical protein